MPLFTLAVFYRAAIQTLVICIRQHKVIILIISVESDSPKTTSIKGHLRIISSFTLKKNLASYEKHHFLEFNVKNINREVLFILLFIKFFLFILHNLLLTLTFY